MKINKSMGNKQETPYRRSNILFIFFFVSLRGANAMRIPYLTVQQI